MAKMKKIQDSREQLLDSTQKLVLCGRAMLDAVEELATLLLPANLAAVAPEDPTAPEALPGDTAERAQKAETGTKGSRDKTASLEEVRGLLAEKARSGYRAEVKALLTAHGVNQLSDISDPVELGRLMEEASLIS